MATEPHRGAGPAGSSWSGAQDWPRTTRLMPWLLAAFAVMLFLVPFHAIQLPVALPVDARFDRLVIGAILVLWLCSLAAGGQYAPRIRWTAIHTMLVLFFAVAAGSVIFNLEVLQNLRETTLAIKQLSSLAALVLIFFFVASILRPTEVEPFVKLLLGLACLAAIGTIWESRTHYNAFYVLATWIPTVSVEPPPVALGIDGVGRWNITGPTGHGLALATMMAMVLPFAVQRVMRVNRSQLYPGIACALLLAAAVATLRKTSFVAPTAALAVMVAYRPRQMARLAPLGLVLIAMIHFMAPGSLGTVKDQLLGERQSQSNSTQARVADYAATKPDMLHHLASGRGYGTYEPRRYRFTDNQYLQLLIEVGAIGVVLYLLLILSVGWTAHRATKSRDPTRSWPALAAVASAGAFATVSFLYDALAFPQAPYLFLLIAGLAAATVVDGGPAVAVEQADLHRRDVEPESGRPGDRVPIHS